MKPDLKNALILSIAIAAMLVTALMATIGFQARYVGWLAEDVPDPMAFRAEWERILTSVAGIQHPAVIHYQPDGCLCYALSSRHAEQISDDAGAAGFHVFQLNTDHADLGTRLSSETAALPFGPLIAITGPDGQLRYAGAYSDGVRCNTGNSMVGSFISADNPVNGPPVIGLDVTVCRCLVDHAGS